MAKSDSSLEGWCLNLLCVKMPSMQELVLDGFYRHYKGKMYCVRGVVRHSETLEEMVYYECLYENDLGKLWVRPKSLFLSQVEIEGVMKPRFEYISSKKN
jgi:hypothetical protein